MLVISKWKDIGQTQGQLNALVFEQIKVDFLELKEHLGPEESLQDFSLRLHGPIGVLESGDTKLTRLGISQLLIETWPEFVAKVNLKGGTVLYKVGLLLDNDFMPIVYVPESATDQELLVWLEEQAETEEGGSDNETQAEPF